MNAQKPRILVCIPCMDQIPTEFVRCLTALEPVGETNISFLAGSLVYASRDKLAQQALEGGYDYLLWLDSDMIFPSSLLRDLYADLQEAGRHFVSGLYFRRKAPYNPVLYKTVRMGLPGEGVAEEYDDYPREQIFEIDACGFGAVLMRAELVRQVIAHDRTGFIPIPGYGEDISFCLRAKRLGFQLYCDSRIRAGHLGTAVVDEAFFDRLQTMKGERNGE